ncbi:hypothetical protein [Paenibacillus sp. sgz302251]|uniref:hypothetical protein n=1 Tax=Paenibacillus sp. sgz302251 TaxID=3414493 RepID=UPI003C7D9772
MKFIHDYRHFIEVGCTSCGRKHTVQIGSYNVSPQGYKFHSPVKCVCGHTAVTAGKEDKKTWINKTENNEFLKRNKATTIKVLLVMAFVIVFFAAEITFMFKTNETEQKSAHHEADREVSSHFVQKQSSRL